MKKFCADLTTPSQDTHVILVYVIINMQYTCNFYLLICAF